MRAFLHFLILIGSLGHVEAFQSPIDKFEWDVKHLSTQHVPATFDQVTVHSAGHERLLPALVAFAGARGYEVVQVELPDGFWGLTSEKRHLIVISSMLNSEQQIISLLHELGHVLAPATVAEDQQEVYAQTFATLVGTQVGIDIYPTSLFYMQSHQSGVKVIDEFKHDLTANAALLVAFIKGV